ncbi:hypothetical protein DM01DRAFT_1336887 [Hesseltinella vesiculosa]|uniref:Telomere length regulation protein conserved domain-containing protein n=1 Tax=Hesseltinella vesiculosa TaxID=101127 RepID=A0A1X2GEB5_9FUNG|nr:hypothetical protein DM01DRAFT_1336887 [Hesseltinella vesiculosa]
MSPTTDAIADLDAPFSPNASVDIEMARKCIKKGVGLVSLATIRQPSWKRHVWLILATFLPQCGLTLTTTDHDQAALHATLMGSVSTCSDELRLALIQASLPTLLECCQLATDNHVSHDVLDTYADLLKQYVTDGSIALYIKYAHAITDCAFFSTMLCSLPAKLANAFGLRHLSDLDSKRSTWYLDSHFYPALARSIANQMKMLATSSQQDSLNMVTELVQKILRQGYENTCMPVLLSVAITDYPSAPASYLSLWHRLWVDLDRSVHKDKRFASWMRYLSQTIASYQGNSIPTTVQTVASHTYPVLFDNSMNSQIQDFLLYALMSKPGQSSTETLRTAVAIGVHALGLTAASDIGRDSTRGWEMTEPASALIGKCADKVLELWVDPVFIHHSSDGERIYLTTGLLILMGYANPDTLVDMEGSIRNGVTRWLKTADASTAKLAMIVAESISERLSNGEDTLDFGVDMEENLLSLKRLAFEPDGLLQVDLDVTMAVLEEHLDEPSESEEELDPDAMMVLEDEEDMMSTSQDEEDPELVPYAMDDESEDEDNDPKKKRIRAPAYLSELSQYLKDQEDPVKLEVGLKAAAAVIQQKRGFGTEADEWAPVLVQRLIYFPESYDIKDFRQLQTQALAALFVASPNIAAPRSIEEIFSKNTSVQQRMTILRSLSIAALELSGWDQIAKSSPSDVAPLPVEDQKNMLEDWSTTSLVKQKSPAKVLFKSSRMAAEQQRQQKIQRNNLAGVAGRSFFFPLVTGWWDATQSRLGWFMDFPMLVEQFIMTLNVIMQCASNTTDKRRIVQEYFELALSMRYIPQLSPRMVRALLLGIHTILQVCYKNQSTLLLSDYSTSLMATRDWLEELIDKPEFSKDLQGLMLALVAALSNL